MTNPAPSWKGQRFIEAGYEAGKRDAQQQPTPGAPLPPDSLVSDWEDHYYKYKPPCSLSNYLAFCGAAWCHAQVFPEREELAALLAKARDTLQSIGYSTNPQIDQSLLTIAAELHAAAERLTTRAQEDTHD